MFFSLIAAAASLATFASAQSSYQYAINPDSVPIATRQSWCQAENNACTSICKMGTADSTPSCNATTLMYGCVCANAPTPDLTKFNNTIPYFECTEYIAQCQANNTQNLKKQQQCLRIQCGGLNPEKYMPGSNSSMPKPKPKPMPMPTGKGGSGNGGMGGSGSGNGGHSHGAAAGLELANSYSLAALVGAGMVLFGFGLGI